MSAAGMRTRPGRYISGEAHLNAGPGATSRLRPRRGPCRTPAMKGMEVTRLHFWIGWGATTPSELAIGMLILLVIGLILGYLIIRAGNKD